MDQIEIKEELKKRSLIIYSENNILNTKGEIAAEVYQYVRYKNIAIKVLKKNYNDLMENNKLYILHFIYFYL